MHTQIRSILFSAFWAAVSPAVAASPAAVIADPAGDAKFPPSLAQTTVPSHGVEMDAWFYQAAGPGPHGTVLLPHGLPGYESNGDLAQSIRRAGWNVLMFNYRGTWGTGGNFSISSAMDDVAAAVRFLRAPATIAKYRLDPRRLVTIGHSFGGFAAGYEASRDKGIAGVAVITAPNLGKINDDPKERATRLERWGTQLHPVHGTTAAALFAEAARHEMDWNYVRWADALRSRPVLLIAAHDQNRKDMQALATALNGAPLLESRYVQTDHSFSDHRIALQTIVIEWLGRLARRRTADER